MFVVWCLSDWCGVVLLRIWCWLALFGWVCVVYYRFTLIVLLLLGCLWCVGLIVVVAVGLRFVVCSCFCLWFTMLVCLFVVWLIDLVLGRTVWLFVFRCCFAFVLFANLVICLVGCGCFSCWLLLVLAVLFIDVVGCWCDVGVWSVVLGSFVGGLLFVCLVGCGW